MSLRRSVHTALAILCALGLLSCNDAAPLRRVKFRARVGGMMRNAAGRMEVRTPSGWDITVTAARVSVGPIYFRNAPPSVGTDTDFGRAVAEVLPQFTVDALDPALVEIPGGGNGTNEPAHSAEVRLFEAETGPIADAAGAGVAIAHVAGTARRGEQTIAFDGTLVLTRNRTTSAYQLYREHRVLHIPVDFTANEGGVLVLRVDPTHWFDAVVFNALAPADAPVRDFSDTSSTTQLNNGIGTSVGVYVFTWEPGS